MRHAVIYCFFALWGLITLEGETWAQSPADTVRAVLAAPDNELSYERAKLTFDIIVTPELDDASITLEINRLASAADRASNALETLAAVENKRTPVANLGPVGDAPIELRRGVTVNWLGPVVPIVQGLANRASYAFLTIGAKPSIPVIVQVDVENRPVIDVLRDIGLQIGVRGTVKVDGNRRVIEIHYAPTTGVGS